MATAQAQDGELSSLQESLVCVQPVCVCVLCLVNQTATPLHFYLMTLSKKWRQGSGLASDTSVY